VEKTVGAKEAKKVEVEEPKSASASASAAPTGGNRVRDITAPDNTGRKSDPVAIQGHAQGGNRVSVEQFGSGSVQDTKTDVAAAAAVAVDAAPSASLAVEAEKELSGSAFALDEKSMIDEELAKAHALMKHAVDETYLKDLELLAPSALKIRVVQLASEMNDRAKWEAVRLKEFLAMKEKEVGEK